MWHSLRKSVLAVDLRARACILISCVLHLFFIIAIVVLHWIKPVQRITVCKDMLITSAVTLIIDPRAPATGLVVNKGVQNTISTSQKTATTIVSEKKVASVKSSKKAAPKKATPSFSAKATADKKKEIKKEKPKPQQKAPAKKKEPTKPKAKPVDVPKKEAAKSESTPAQEALLAAALPANIEGPIMVARSAADASALTVQLEIQQALLHVWHPPVGMEGGISCQIRVTLESTGTVKSIEIVKPSGMRLFDASARAAIQQTAWPRGVWGTTLELCLQ
jgi:TonB family protein